MKKKCATNKNLMNEMKLHIADIDIYLAKNKTKIGISSDKMCLGLALEKL